MGPIGSDTNRHPDKPNLYIDRGRKGRREVERKEVRRNGLKEKKSRTGSKDYTRINVLKTKFLYSESGI